MPDTKYTYPKPITIEMVVDSPAEDDFGHFDATDPANWETYFTGFARVLSRGSREFVRVQQLDASVSFALVVRWSSETAAIKPQTMRVQYLGRTLQISGVENEDEENREVILACSELVEA